MVGHAGDRKNNCLPTKVLLLGVGVEVQMTPCLEIKVADTNFTNLSAQVTVSL